MANLRAMTREKLRQLEYRYGLQRVQIKDPKVAAEIWAFRYREGERTLVTVTTVDQPQDFLVTAFEEDLGAAVALLRLVLSRTDGPWVPGRVWLNDVPILEGTAIQGIVTAEGDWSEIVALTEAEAELVARETISAITICRGRNSTAFLDLFRKNAFQNITDEELAQTAVYVSTHARTAPLRKIKALAHHRFAAFTNEETSEYLGNPDNFERATAAEILPRVHGARLFFHGAEPGETLTYTAQGWQFSVT